MIRKLSILTIALGFFILSAGASLAADNKIEIGAVGWTGVTIKSQVTATLLDSLGYDTKVKTMSVPIVYLGLSKGDVDFFLGNWMPSMATVAEKYFKDGSVIKYQVNMPGAKYTLAVPTYCIEMGLKDFSDIAKFGDQLEWKIYGIEAGNDGNLIIRDMIKKDMFGLGKFKIIPSSESAMLSEVQAFATQKKPIVFLGWAPHSMNERIDMTYLTGSTDETFGGDDGTATVWTNTRKGFEADQPNVAKLLKQQEFPVPMVNQIMTAMFNDKTLKHKEAGLKWLKANPERYEKWLEGVTTVDGKPAAPVFKAYLDANVK